MVNHAFNSKKMQKKKRLNQYISYLQDIAYDANTPVNIKTDIGYVALYPPSKWGEES